MRKLAIFASGGGSNAKKLIEYFKDSNEVSIALIVCNKPNAGVLSIARSAGIETLLINKVDFYETTNCIKLLEQYEIEFIILAGFLWKVPDYLINAFAKKIINIHPALLPKYGGKGMYGIHVHTAVVAAQEKETGITIHLVDEVYDNGEILFQTSCKLAPTDTPTEVAAKVLTLEHAHFAEVVEQYVTKIS